MGNSIITRTISAVQENAISMSNGHFARTLDFGTGWSKIRVGMRYHMGDSGADLTGTPSFAFGICSGTTNIFGDATVTHFLGALSLATTWTRTPAQTAYNINTGSFVSLVKKVGSTLTTGSLLSNTANCRMPYTAASNTTDRVCMFLDITKGSPNYTVQLFHWYNTNSPADVSQASFLSQMESATPTLTDHIIDTAQTIAVNEGTNGTFDSINFSWDRTSPTIEICDLAFARLS